MFLRAAEGEPWPDLSDQALEAGRENWLVPALYDKTSLKDLSPGNLSEALMARLPWEQRGRLDREAPTHSEAPTGTMLAIEWEAEQGPTIAVRLQELFGLNVHPSLAKGAVPLVLELLSPAHRPVQVTRDLPGTGAAVTQIGTNRCVTAAPEARQVARHLDRPVRRRQ